MNALNTFQMKFNYLVSAIAALLASRSWPQVPSTVSNIVCEALHSHIISYNVALHHEVVIIFFKKKDLILTPAKNFLS